ncbi:hypothetical protein AGMMS50229_21630 [Campylobacterota bacterium]|nr:hypothetical protein AGMMS50229_21630 [Campylobacterota bacterium]
MIIKERAGELGHFDCKHLPNGMVEGFKGKLYLVGGIDDCTRLAWVELMTDITSLSVMFGAMGIMRLLQSRYNIRFERIMTDNGSEFKSNKTMLHPFERLLHQLSIKHIYTKPYKPQPNGKQRVWEWAKQYGATEPKARCCEEMLCTRALLRRLPYATKCQLC